MPDPRLTVGLRQSLDFQRDIWAVEAKLDGELVGQLTLAGAALDELLDVLQQLADQAPVIDAIKLWYIEAGHLWGRTDCARGRLAAAIVEYLSKRPLFDAREQAAILALRAIPQDWGTTGETDAD